MKKLLLITGALMLALSSSIASAVSTTPTGFAISSSDLGVQLTWNPDDNTTYRVFRNGLQIQEDITDNSYVDMNALVGEEAAYFIVGCDSDTTLPCSPGTDSLFVTFEGAWPPEAGTDRGLLLVTACPAVGNMSVNGLVPSGVFINAGILIWNLATGATGYNIYSDNAYVTTVGGGVSSFDTSAIGGSSFYVTAIYAPGVLGASQVISARSADAVAGGGAGGLVCPTQGDLDAANATIATLTEALAEANAIIAAAGDSVGGDATTIATLQAQIDTLVTENEALAAANAVLAEGTGSTAADLAAAEAALIALQADLDICNADFAIANEAIADQQVIIGELDDELEAAENSVIELTAANTTLTSENETLTEENAALLVGTGLAALIATNTALTEDNAELVLSNTTLTADNESLTAENETLTSDNATLLADNGALVTSNTAFIAENTALTSTNEGLTEDLTEVTEDLAIASASVVELTGENSQLTIDLAACLADLSTATASL